MIEEIEKVVFSSLENHPENFFTNFYPVKEALAVGFYRWHFYWKWLIQIS